jgi:hypothetical protein
MIDEKQNHFKEQLKMFGMKALPYALSNFTLVIPTNIFTPLMILLVMLVVEKEGEQWYFVLLVLILFSNALTTFSMTL